MMRMGRKKHNISVSDAPNRDPFALVPIIAEGVETREDSQGLLQLRACPPVKRGIMTSVARQLGMYPCVRVNLDSYGSMFWRRIDGHCTLREIERRIRQQTNQDARDTEKAVILFTQMLMQRHLIVLAVPKGTE